MHLLLATFGDGFNPALKIASINAPPILADCPFLSLPFADFRRLLLLTAPPLQ
jgi:hypothetical protein